MLCSHRRQAQWLFSVGNLRGGRPRTNSAGAAYDANVRDFGPGRCSVLFREKWEVDDRFRHRSLRCGQGFTC